VAQAARFHDVWVITHATGKGSIEEALAANPMPNVRWVYVDLPRWAAFLESPKPGIEHIHYCLWQLAAWPVAARLDREVRFDLVHHVTLVNFWLPVFAGLLRPPLVWGPVGGGESVPTSLWRGLGWRGWLFESFRLLARATAWLNPVVRVTARRARVALATTEQTADKMRRMGARRVIVEPGSSLPETEVASLAEFTRSPTERFRMVSAARLLAFKGFHLAVEAFARLAESHPGSEYWIVGDGPDRRRLEGLAAELGVSESVRFWGWLPRAEAMKRMGEAHVLVHPSFHESGGWVCLEGMAAGLPVVCLDIGGPAVLVNQESGFKVPPGTPDKVVAGLHEAMNRLAVDPSLAARMGQAGQARVWSEFTWTRRGERMNEWYEEAWRRRSGG